MSVPTTSGSAGPLGADVAATASAQGSPGRSSPAARGESRAAFLFVLPWVIGFLIFTAGPAIASFYYSLTEYDVLQPPEWVGLQNYREIFTADELFYKSLRNTIYYTVLYVPLHIISALGIAMLLNTRVRGIPFWRTFFYLPSVLPVVAVAILWRFLLNPQQGAINQLLSAVGLPTPGWTTDPNWMVPALSLMITWGGAGPAMIILLAGLKNIPRELYEAAELDGAGWWAKTRRITVPMLSPVLFFLSIVGIISALGVFAQSRVLYNEDGGPGNAALVYMMYLFNTAFEYFRMGYASALAYILFVITITFTLLQFWLSRRWVYYEGGANK
jgi:multiple sugar transport system permease protein